MSRLKPFPLLFFLLPAVLIAIPSVAHAEGEITVVSTSCENQYPTQLKFAVEAKSASTITKVILRYKEVNDPATGYSNATFTPSTDAKATYLWDTQRQYIPPGVQLSYYWQLEDEAGHKLQTAPTTVTVDDTRFQWQSVSSGQLTMYYYKGDTSFAQDLLGAGTRAIKQLSEEVGVELKEPVKIFLYNTQQDMLGALPPHGVEWTGGEAFPEAGIIVLTAPPTASGRDYGLRTVPHELSHLIVHAATDNPFGGVPSWLDEGLAMYAEGDLESQYQAALSIAISQNSLLSLQSLSGNFPTDPQQSLLGYAESYSVVKYMLSKYGRNDMSKLLGIFHDGSTVNDALRQAYQLDETGLEAAWRTSIGAKALPAQAAESPAETPSPAEPDLRATAVPRSAAPSAVATAAPSTTQGSGRSCFGGLLGVAGAAGALLLLATRLRP